MSELDTGVRKLLIVDDEPDLQHLMRQKFRRRIRKGEWDMTFAANGVEALEALSADPGIEMVLSDINMPRMDGLTLLDQLSKNTPDIRAVIVSAYGDMENIRTAMNRGAFDFLTKPINFSDLEITVEKTLKHVSLLRNALRSRDQLVALRQELEVAQAMQKSILPTVFPKRPDCQVWAEMVPAGEVAGDFFDIMPLEYDRLGLVMADVSGKGVPAALFMMVCRTVIKGTALGIGQADRILAEANNIICAENDANMFVTVFFHILDPQSGELTYANGGHDRPFLVHPDGSLVCLDESPGVALGVVDGMSYAMSKVQLNPGDLIFSYTDGVTEAENAEGEQFGLERLMETLSKLGGGSPEAATKGVIEAVQGFVQDAKQHDDITCMTVRYGPI